MNLREDLHRLALHNALETLAWTLSAGFSAVFLLRAGLSPSQIFLFFGATLAIRFALRPLILLLAPRLGLRRTFMLGAFFCALSYPTLSFVHDIGLPLFAFVALTAIGQVFYCTCYHVYFAALSDDDERGTQVGVFQTLGTLAAVVGPAAGGLLLATAGPGPTFGLALLVGVAAMLPLRHMRDIAVKRREPRVVYAGAITGAKLYFADGWIQVFLTTAWSIVLFHALNDRYDNFGGTLSLAALAGAAGGIAFGKLIDKGHRVFAVWLNAAALMLIILLRATTFGSPFAAVTIAIVTAVLGGLYLPSWMTAAYGEARRSSSTFRFQFAAEGGWDAGGAAACLLAALLSEIGLSMDVIVLAALPAAALQCWFLHEIYSLRLPPSPLVDAGAKVL